MKNTLAIVALAALLAATPACKSEPKPSTTRPSASVATKPTIVLPTADPSALPATSGWVPILYKIDGAHPSYLLGTIHVGDARLSGFPAVLEKDFAASEELVTEVVMDSMDKNKFALGTLLDGKTLDQVVAPPIWAKTQSAFGALGVPSSAYSHMKPWAVAVQITLIDHIKDLEGGVDMRLTSRARAGKKTVSALETFEEQLDVFDKVSGSEQEAMLDEALTQREKAKKEGRDPIKELLDAYVSGDEERVLASLDKDFDPKSALDVKMRQRLVYDRNEIMEKRIVDRTRDGARSYFFAVGTAHVVGPEGIVARLRAAGVKVERER